jgi:hypothetical protein
MQGRWRRETDFSRASEPPSLSQVAKSTRLPESSYQRLNKKRLRHVRAIVIHTWAIVKDGLPTENAALRNQVVRLE